MRTTILVLAAALAAAGCEKSDGKGAPPATMGGVDAVLDAWKQAGLTVGVFDPADGAKYGGGECRAGQVNGIDAVLCHYASPELAKAAEAKGLEAVGEATGSSIAEGRVLLLVADRRKVDPEGRTINQTTKVFRGRGR
jgi:hypothetical protein